LKPQVVLVEALRIMAEARRDLVPDLSNLLDYGITWG